MDKLRMMSIMVPAEIHAWLRDEAYRRGTSMSRLITEAVRQMMAEADGQPVD